MASVEKLPPEVEASYSAIIDGILASSDLTTISAKAIRKGLQGQVDYDISAQKKQITDLIMARFDKFTADNAPAAAAEPPEPAPTAKMPTKATTNGAAPGRKQANGSKKRASPSPSDDEESDLTSAATSPPPKKKHKKSRSVELSDAALAARLQAEENGRSARATRGAGTAKRKTPAKKAKREKKGKKKSKDHVGSDDDSDAASGEKKEVKRTGGFHKPMALSEPLTALLGETQLSRPQTVKKIWEYIKANDLQDPADKRQIRCDTALRTVFKTDRVHMFTMNKILNQNLYAVDE